MIETITKFKVNTSLQSTSMIKSEMAFCVFTIRFNHTLAHKLDQKPDDPITTFRP